MQEAVQLSRRGWDWVHGWRVASGRHADSCLFTVTGGKADEMGIDIHDGSLWKNSKEGKEIENHVKIETVEGECVDSNYWKVVM